MGEIIHWITLLEVLEFLVFFFQKMTQKNVPTKVKTAELAPYVRGSDLVDPVDTPALPSTVLLC